MTRTALLLFTFLLLSNVNLYAFDTEDIEIHGFISQGYLKSSDHDLWLTPTSEGTFQFNEMGVSIMCEPIANTRLGVQLLSRDLGEVGNNEVAPDWAYGDYRFRNWLGIRVGLLKRPYGLYNQSRDIDAARTGVFLPMSVYSEISREYYLSTRGVALYGLLPGGLSYEIQYGDIPLDIEDGIIKQAENTIGAKAIDVDNDYVTAFQLRWETPLEGLLLAFSTFNAVGITGKMDLGEVDTETYESHLFSMEFDLGDFSFAAEYMVEPIKISLNQEFIILDITTEAYYAKAGYQLTDRFKPALAYFVYYLDKGDRKGDSYKEIGEPAARGWMKGVTLSARFDINDYWTFKLEGHLINGLGGVYNIAEKDPKEDWFLFAAKTTFSF